MPPHQYSKKPKLPPIEHVARRINSIRIKRKRLRQQLVKAIRAGKKFPSLKMNSTIEKLKSERLKNNVALRKELTELASSRRKDKRVEHAQEVLQRYQQRLVH